MRILLGALAIAVALSWAAPRSTLAGASDREKLDKLVHKLAIPTSTVFTPKFKPKGVCYCRTDSSKRVGFLATFDGTTINCAVPTTISAEGMLQVVDYGCQDFEVLNK